MVIYLDNNATTRPDLRVIEAMWPYFTEFWANPSSVHRFGQRARLGVDQARQQVAALLGCSESELIFTGSGTEAVNTVIRGVLAARGERRRIVTSAVEHSAARELCQQLGKDGFEIIEIAVDSQGLLDLEQLESAVGDETALVTVMWANNETGVIFPIDRIASICHERKIPLHVDGTQAMGKLAVDVKASPIDLMSFAGHKFHGPKGVGGLYVRRGARMRPWLIGGPQERSRRGGTENVPGIVGMGMAAEIAGRELARMADVAIRRDRLERSILARIPDSHVNGHREHRLVNTTNIGFARLQAEAILLLLSEQEICASAGAACSSGSLEPSHVLRAMGIDPKIAHGAVRFSLSRETTDAEIDQTLDVLPEIIARLRRVLPI